MNTPLAPCLRLISLVGLCALAIPVDAAQARSWSERLGLSQGIAVVLGDTRGDLARQLATTTDLMVYVQLDKDTDVEATRRVMEAAGLYGGRVFVDRGTAGKIALADNLADVVIALGDGETPDTEILRVLRPKGRALWGERELVKPLPEGVDDWSHPYHGPDNNPASRDQVAKGPYLTQFLADPRYAPLPQAAVAAGGRIFKLFGHIAFKEREEPWLNTLAAFNGYNGTFLWRRPIPAGINVHRSTIVATSERVYYADDTSCKVLDAATGELRDEIAPPPEQAGGTFWKWMALDQDLLFAMVGEQEQRDPIIRMRSERHGWPWDPLSPGFNQPELPWGFGQTLLAIDPDSKSIRWRHHEAEAFDGRATCIRSGKVFLFRHGSYLACLDAATGRQIWRRTPADSPALFEALGPDLPRQDWRTNWRTTAYTRASDDALYLAGPTISRLLAVSTADGSLLWQHPYSNYQLVLQGNALWALSGQIDKEPSRKFDPRTGQILQELNLSRRACARPTGALDAIFCRASGGSTRLSIDDAQAQLVSPMRAQCQDGVTIANGLLYWWPSTCDCNLSLYGITSLGPAGDFDFAAAAGETDRLEAAPNRAPSASATQGASPSGDWPTFRADNIASATVDFPVSARSVRLWQAAPNTEIAPTAPTLSGGLAFVAGSDGVVRALDTTNGELRWKAFTGGSVRYPPTLWKDLALVGSGDGWVYAFQASDGALVWRFRAAPVERKIPVYGQLLSTWPAASGVLVDNGVAYVAAGIVNFDGTHVYALDAATGRLKWQNNVSGHLDPEGLAGVSVQGHMIIHQDRLWLAGGNVVSPGIFDLSDGRCLNDPDQVHRLDGGFTPSSESPRGSSLFVLADQVFVSDQPLYAHPKWKVYDSSVLQKTWLASSADHDFTWVNNNRVACYPRIREDRAARLRKSWGQPLIEGAEPVWQRESKESSAVALASNALIVGRPSELAALDRRTGRPLWVHTLPGVPVPWGIALDRSGRVIVSLEGGQVVCFGGPNQVRPARRDQQASIRRR